MLKKINRITSKKEFERIKKEGDIIHGSFWGLVKCVADEGKKFGFVISKKISKKAVIRNKIRRKLAEEVRKNLNKFEDGFRGIFLVKKNILDEKGNIKDFKIL